METYTKINKDILRKTILEDLEKQPKTIVVFDDSLQFQIETLGERKKEISKLLKYPIKWQLHSMTQQ
jgi:hypothetical protein